VKFIYIIQSIKLFNRSICTHDRKCLSVAMAEDSLHTLHSSIQLINLYSLHLSNRSIKRRFLVNRTSVWRRWRFPCTRGRAVAVAEGGRDRRRSGGRGDRLERHRRRWRRERRRLREFWDKKRNNTRWTTICKFENISSGS
jgi:hypothetical protein